MTDATVQNLGVMILALPLLAAGLIGLLGRPALRDDSHYVAIAGVAWAAVSSLLLMGLMLMADPHDRTAHVVIYEWIAAGVGAMGGAGSSWFHFEFLVDPLTAVMLVTVTFVSTLVVIYSRDYMRHHGKPEAGYERFFAYLALFVFSMCLLVLSGNFLMLYMGWELVGLSSYLLIGFYYSKPSAAAAAKKAFLVNRIGDFGFGLGILAIYLTFGRLDYQGVFAMIEQGVSADGWGIPDGRLTWIALLLFCGAVGKSAQLPLYVWLPDAMEGPSPVSALIHAATMVTAGVYMVARCGAIFAASPVMMNVVAITGAATALFAATIALTQHDMKRILAYSTISQLGYMFMGLGVYAAGSAVFHLFTHAFFKALLFLGAGSVMHAMGGVIDLRRFGGLRHVLPHTFKLVFIGSLALAGFPLLAGFWSKDEIIHHAFEHNWLLGAIGLITAALTAFYTFRMVFRAFYGQERVPDGVHAHESGGWMIWPMAVLAVGAVFAGYVSVGPFIESVTHPFTAAMHGAAGHGAELVGHAAEAAHGGGEWLMVVSGLLAIGGIGLAYLLYVLWPWVPPLVAEMFPRVHRYLFNKYYVDEAYDASVVKPLRAGGNLCFASDNYVVDGLVWMVTAVPKSIAYGLRRLQNGSMQGYGLTMAAGAGAILLIVLLS